MALRPFASLLVSSVLAGCTLIDLSQLGTGAGSSGGESSAGNDPGGGSDGVGGANQGGGGVSQGGAGGTPAPTYADCILGDGPAIFFRANSDASAVEEKNLGTLGGAGTFSGAHIPFPGIADEADQSTRFNSLEGTGSITIASGALFGGYKPFSLETWIEVPAPIATVSLFASSDGTNNLDLRIVKRADQTGDDSLVLRFQTAASTERTVTHFLDLEEPQAQVLHIVAVYRQVEGQVFAGDGSSDDMLLYVNGMATADSAQGDQVPLPEITAPLSIGNGFDGLMDEIAVYPRELDATEVASHYAAGGDPSTCRR